MNRNFTSLLKMPFQCVLNLAVLFGIMAIDTELYAQYFKPFDAGSKAVYTTWPDKGATSSLEFRSTAVEGVDSIFMPAKRFVFDYFDNPVLSVEDCQFWGSGNECSLLNIAPWVGAEMRGFPDLKYEFMTSLGDTLYFDFEMEEGDSSLIYSDFEQSLYLNL